MDMKEFKGSVEAAIARDKEWLEKIESVLQKASCQDPASKKIFAPLRGLKRTLLKNLKVHEKFLEQISKKGL